MVFSLYAQMMQSPASLSSPFVILLNVLTLFSTKMFLSSVQVILGNMRIILIILWILGKSSLLDVFDVDFRVVEDF